MPKKIVPISLPHDGFIYDDEAGKPSTLNLDHLSESFQLSDLLKKLGHNDAGEFARPVRILGGFKPARMIERLREYADACGGSACLACINSERLPEFFWSYACSDVNDLVRLKLAGGHILGFLCFPSCGGVDAYAEEGPDKELSLLILNGFARAYATHPEYLAAGELLALADSPADVKTTLDAYSEWSDRHPINIHDEITFPESRV
jgi:hypothetical protein